MLIEGGPRHPESANPLLTYAQCTAYMVVNNSKETKERVLGAFVVGTTRSREDIGEASFSVWRMPGHPK